MTWRAQLGEAEFPRFEKFLRPQDVVSSILDPDFPSQVLDLEERPDGDFDAFSREIPSHRAPLQVKRRDAVRLVPDCPALAAEISSKMDFAPGSSTVGRTGNFFEIGARSIPLQQLQTVFLFIPGHGPRALSIKEGLLGIESALVLMPTASGMSYELRQIAASRNIGIHILTKESDLPTPSVTGNKGKNKSTRLPLIPCRKGWEWKHLTVVFGKNGLRARIQNFERFASWKELSLRPIRGRAIQGPLKVLSELSNGGRIKQRRGNQNERTKLSRARRVLQELFPLPGDPFYRFSDGYGILFHVEFESSDNFRDHEAPEPENEDAVPIGKDMFDPEDLEEFSIHTT